jgi:phosphoenolpyruvate carboxylase
MEAFIDVCHELDTFSQVDYKLTERYAGLDQEVYDLYCWHDEKKRIFDQYKRERKVMDDKVKRLKGELKLLKNDVQTIKSQESSRAQL